MVENKVQSSPESHILKPEKKKLKINKVLILTFALVFLVVVILLSFYFLERKKTGQPSQNNVGNLSSDLASYEDSVLEFSFQYPKEWGEVTSRKVAEREVLSTTNNSDISITVGPHFDRENNQTLTANELAESTMREGCQKSESSLNEYPVIKVSCLRSRNSSEQAYVQVDDNLYIIFYRYDATEIPQEEVQNTFNSVYNSFKLL